MLVFMLLLFLIVQAFAFTLLVGACRAASRADHSIRQEEQRSDRFQRNVGAETASVTRPLSPGVWRHSLRL